MGIFWSARIKLPPSGELSPKVTERVLPRAPPLPQEAGAAAAVFLHDPTCENAAPERPQAFRGCRSKIIFPLKMPRAARRAF